MPAGHTRPASIMADAIQTSPLPMIFNDKTPLRTQLAIVAFVVVIFCIDLVTPLGVNIWLFYLVPVMLCLYLRRPEYPYLLALVCTGLMTIGYFASPKGMSWLFALSNRAFGVVALFTVASLTSRVVTERLASQHKLWTEAGRSRLAEAMAGEADLATVCIAVMRALAEHTGAHVGLLYRADQGRLVPVAGYGLDRAPGDLPFVPIGQGLSGEVARNGRALLVDEVPAGYLRYGSGLGSADPARLLIAPATVDGKVCGVIELGFADRRSSADDARQLLLEVAEPIGIAMRTALYREHLEALLEETQRQSEELQTQQEELRVSNEELEEQSRVLRESQSRLENQQEELEATNVQLEEQAQLLQQQKEDLQRSKADVERSVRELGRANQVKSEFLANMSHELRTPLNSSLILSQILAENKSGNLTEEQVRYARTIQSSNKALLSLINDILDLSKIEAGHMTAEPERFALASTVETMEATFEPLAAEKALRFRVDVAPDAPQELFTDPQRLEQILKNLLSNAIKFTQQGEVALHVRRGAPGRVAFAVADTGIGISAQQQQFIFDAFRQADGTTSRNYGGTGLGLSISRELAHLLDGDIRLDSEPGRGSTFTLEIAVGLGRGRTEDGRDEHDERNERDPAPPAPAIPAAEPPATALPALRRRHDRLLLLVESNPRFSAALAELAEERGFDCLHAATAGEAIQMAREHKPHGILLDVGLPDRSGVALLESLQRDQATREIPLHVVSIAEHVRGAFTDETEGFSLRPVAREELAGAIGRLEDKLQDRVRRLLIVEDNPAQREALVEMLKAEDLQITVAGTAAEALAQLTDGSFDCVVMDLMLPDGSGYDLLEGMAEEGVHAFPPVIVYTGRHLDSAEEQRLRRYSQSIIIKGAKSPARLLDEVALFLHRVESRLPPAPHALLAQARERESVFERRRILLVEDDVRNIFALTSILEPLGAEVDIARNGREALDRLAARRDYDLVLMDLMMPEMDGLSATREIRKRPELAKLPIIALTAKAMADDRKSCLEAGANDYIAKPIDVDKLVSLCRIWMPK